MIEITVTADGQAARKHRFDGPEVRIGRDADNDLVLASTGCSRHHAKIVPEGAGYRLIDLGSVNGLLFGTEVVRELPLADGVAVTIGDHRLAFSLPEQASPQATVRMFYGSPAAIAPPEPAPPVAAPPAPLYLVYGSGRGERVLKIVAGAEYVIGRSPSADLVLEDRECSKRHALIYARGGGFFVVDLESANGTFIGGERVRDAPIEAGSEIVIGQARVQIQDQIHDVSDRANLLERTFIARPAMPLPVEPPDRRQGPSPRRRPLAVALAVAGIVAIAALGYVAGRRPRATSPAAGAPDAARRLDGRQGEQRSGGGPAEQRPGPGPAERHPEGGPTEQRPGEGPAKYVVQVAPVRLRELVSDLSGSGTVEAQRRVTVSAEVGARVVEVAAREGDWVEQGALLLRLSDRDVQHRIEAARASITREQVALARQDYERKQRLFDDGAVVRSVLEQAESRYLSLDSSYRSNRARIAQLEAQLAKTRVAAPISGVVTRLAVTAGEVVGPGAPVAALENMDEVLVVLKLADRDFVKVRRGLPVEATAAAFPGEVFAGEVARLGSAADPVTRTFEVESRLRNPGLRLRPGLIVSLRIILDRKGGLAIPADALIEETDDVGLVFVAREGSVQRREVTLGQRLDREVEVLAGLAEGEEVVVVGHQELTDGDAVETYTANPGR